jgi:hypothetical protein
MANTLCLTNSKLSYCEINEGKINATVWKICEQANEAKLVKARAKANRPIRPPKGELRLPASLQVLLYAHHPDE